MLLISVKVLPAGLRNVFIIVFIWLRIFPFPFVMIRINFWSHWISRLSDCICACHDAFVPSVWYYFNCTTSHSLYYINTDWQLDKPNNNTLMVLFYLVWHEYREGGRGRERERERESRHYIHVQLYTLYIYIYTCIKIIITCLQCYVYCYAFKMSREYPPMKGFPPFFCEKGVYSFTLLTLFTCMGSAPSGPLLLLLYNDMYYYYANGLCLYVVVMWCVCVCAFIVCILKWF